MSWEYYVAEELEPNVLCACPIEFNDDGSPKCVVTGMNLVTNLEALIEQGARKVWQVDSIEEGGNARLVHDADALEADDEA